MSWLETLLLHWYITLTDLLLDQVKHNEPCLQLLAMEHFNCWLCLLISAISEDVTSNIFRKSNPKKASSRLEPCRSQRSCAWSELRLKQVLITKLVKTYFSEQVLNNKILFFPAILNATVRESIFLQYNEWL